MIGIVTTLEGDPLPQGAIASRLGGFDDVAALETQAGSTDFQLMGVILGSKNSLHNNYQDFQIFLDWGGKIGLQHDPLLYGAYNLNPFLVRVEQVPMLVVEQGQVAVIKAYGGLPTQDTSGANFKFGSLVRLGHQGIWQEALRTGKYPINPRIYDAKVVLTAILKLDWAKDVTCAHGLDARLEPIIAKSNEGFDLQVLIHVPDTNAPRVISMVDSMENLVNEVLQAAVWESFPRQDWRHGGDQVHPDAPSGARDIFRPFERAQAQLRSPQRAEQKISGASSWSFLPSSSAVYTNFRSRCGGRRAPDGHKCGGLPSLRTY